jgi:aminoglycoside 6'-N-acetyltransferase I
MAVTIRPATKKDLHAWAAMRHALWPEAGLAELTEELPVWLKKRKFRAWIAESKGQALGFAEAYVREFANGCEGRPVAFLEGVWVRPGHRKLGIGRRLIGAVEAWALAQGLRELGSDAYVAARASRACHRAWGFVETERVVYFRKRLKRP